MRVLYLDQSGQMGGGEIALLPWLRHTREEASVLLFEDGPFRQRLQEEGVAVQVLGLAGLKQVRRESGWKAALRSVPLLLGVRSEVRAAARAYDALYANSMKALLVAAMARRRGQPLVWHLRDILSEDHFSGTLRRIVVQVANRCATRVIANSEATADAFVRSGGYRRKVTVVYDGVDASRFVPLLESERQQLRAPFTRPGRMLVGVFSRLSHWKGQHVVLDAISALPEVDVLMVGDALFGENAYAESLHARANEPALAGRVNFLGFRSDVATLMQCVDVVVHSSTAAEPFGLVIVEGMLAARPVIATRAGGAVEIVRDRESGLLVSPGSAEELRAGLLLLSNSPELSARLAAEGRRRAETTFPLDALFRGLQEVLQQVCEGAPYVATARRRPPESADAHGGSSLAAAEGTGKAC